MQRFFFLIAIILLLSCSNKKGEPFVKRVGEKGCFIEIPKNILHKDFLLAARIKSLDKSAKKQKLRLDAGQRLYKPVWVRFEKENDTLKMFAMSGLQHRKNRKNGKKAWQTFSIMEETEKSIIVDWTAFFCRGIGGVDPYNEKTQPAPSIDSLNSILNIRIDGTNLEVLVRYAFEEDEETLVALVQKSFLLLPELEMKKRLYDARVGYHTTKIAGSKYINRFRLIPSDTSAYFSGKKTPPIHPIVFYIDDAFPTLWKKAIRVGILDWNKAFERIGFKEVIQVRDFSNEDDDFNPIDFKYNCFHYVHSDFPNAQGNHWSDPRTGEILQADVLFYSNILSLLQKWYFLQTASYNPLARQRTLPDSVTFRILRYAAAHEIGHCLGLEHNFRASYAFNTEDLRNPDFTEKYGTTPSIMDYARFNYVAQPCDNVKNVYPPLLGVYDHYSIKIGYQYLQNENTDSVAKWIDKKSGDPLFLCSRLSPSSLQIDPSVQSKDLGNDLVASSQYGIANLRVILENIEEWNIDSSNPFDGFPATYEDLENCYFDYVESVIPLIAGCYKYKTRSGEDQKEYVQKKESIQALKFIIRELQTGYRFLHQSEKYAGDRRKAITERREKIRKKLLSNAMKNKIEEAETHTGFSYKYYNKILQEINF